MELPLFELRPLRLRNFGYFGFIASHPSNKDKNVAMVRHPRYSRAGSVACGQALKLAKMVQIVPGHGFDDGLEGHGAALGVRDGAVGGRG